MEASVEATITVVTMEGAIPHPVEEKSRARAEGLTEHLINQQWHFAGSPPDPDTPPHLSPPCASCGTKPATQGALRTLLARCNAVKLIINTSVHEMKMLNDRIFF